MNERTEVDRRASASTRLATCVLALGLTWWPFAFVLHIAVLVKTNPGAAIALGYVLQVMIASSAVGVLVAVTRRSRPASRCDRLVIALAVLPVPLIVLRLPVALASYF